MSACTFSIDEAGQDGNGLVSAGATVMVGAVLGTVVAVVAAVGTVLVGAATLVCVAATATLVVAALLAVAVGLVVTGALALTLGIMAGGLAVVLRTGSWLGRSVGSVFERFGTLRARRVALLQPSKSSAS